MPKVLDIQIRATKFEAPQLRNFASSLPSSSDAVEFIVRRTGRSRVAASVRSPYVGDTPVTEVTKIESNTYRFIAPVRAGLKQGARSA